MEVGTIIFSIDNLLLLSVLQVIKGIVGTIHVNQIKLIKEIELPLAERISCGLLNKDAKFAFLYAI